jgi:alkylated DNA repair dioxygenase AlkB
VRPATDAQGDLFGGAAGAPAEAGSAPPEGWLYRADFLAPEEEAELLGHIGALPLEAARYKSYTARRRVAGFGSAYDFDRNRAVPAAPLPPWLERLAARCAAWAGLEAGALTSALVAEYRPGTPLGWHRDAPGFETIVGVSLASACRMRLRRYPPIEPKKAGVLTVDLAPRSIYRMQGPARWGWQHSVAPTPALRYSVTFRTRRAGLDRLSAG